MVVNRTRYHAGSLPITANDAKEPSSYLTCLEGKPWDGLRCRIKSYMSVQNDLVVEGVDVGVAGLGRYRGGL